MDNDKTIVLLFLTLGIISGLISNYAPDVILKFLVPISIYVATNALLIRTLKTKKARLIVINSFATFVPLWLIIWIFLFNLR